MAKMQIIGDPVGDLLEEMDRKGIELKPAVNEALEETMKLISSNLSTDAQIYQDKGGGQQGYATGAMYKSIIKDSAVHWTGNIAEVNAGFNLDKKGGIHSIFVMYGTPRMSKDTKVYNAVKGKKTKNSIERLQKRIMMKHMKLGG